jgi:hypothetical protein
LSGFSNLDNNPNVFKTIDGGQTRSDLSTNLQNIPANDIIIIPSAGGDVLVLATDMNVWYSEDDGTTWDILGNDLPPTIIRDLKYHGPTETLYAGTFGRSIHQIDLSDLVLSVEEIDTTTTTNTRVFPNPTTDQFTIQHTLQGSGSITLYDVTGKKVKTLFEGNLETAQNAFYNRNNLTSGIYLLQLKSQDKTVSKKLIVN